MLTSSPYLFAVHAGLTPSWAVRLLRTFFDKYDTYLLIVVASLIVWWNREDMFTKVGSVTEVIPNRRKVGPMAKHSIHSDGNSAALHSRQ